MTVCRKCEWEIEEVAPGDWRTGPFFSDADSECPDDGRSHEPS